MTSSVWTKQILPLACAVGASGFLGYSAGHAGGEALADLIQDEDLIAAADTDADLTGQPDLLQPAPDSTQLHESLTFALGLSALSLTMVLTGTGRATPTPVAATRTAAPVSVYQQKRQAAEPFLKEATGLANRFGRRISDGGFKKLYVAVASAIRLMGPDHPDLQDAIRPFLKVGINGKMNRPVYYNRIFAYANERQHLEDFAHTLVRAVRDRDGWLRTPLEQIEAKGRIAAWVRANQKSF